MTSCARFSICLALVAMLGSKSDLAAAETTKAPDSAALLGRSIDDFTLGDWRGKEFNLSDCDADLVVVAFIGNECPLAKLYAPRLARLAERFKDRSVAFVAINANQQDSMAALAAFARDHKVEFPVLKDPGNKVADQFGAQRTPEVFVLDKDRKVRYVGRIDDQYGIGYQRPEVPREDLAIAVEELLEGKPVSMAATPAMGCLIGRVNRVEPHGEITYASQVAQILNHRCVECHREGQVAPFALDNYEQAVGWAEMIREVVSQRRMPPWHADPKFAGHFINDPSLSDAEKQTLYDWIDNGCPQGDMSKAPAPIEYAKGWMIPEPDQIFYMSEKPVAVPAEGTVAYKYFTVDPGFTEDRWVKAAEARPGNAAVVHHIIVFIHGGDAGGRFGKPQIAFAPGMPPRRFDDGMAIRIPAGARLLFQMHYTPNGTEQEDRSYVGFVYADPKEVKYEVMGEACGQMMFRIPPGDPNYRVIATERFRKDTLLLGMNPHMHLRGKSFRYDLEYPDGRSETILDVPRYDFNWQLWYLLPEPMRIPKGTLMRCTAYFDNSTENLSNPDPTASVGWGEQTWDEMMFGFFSTIEPVDPSSESKPEPRRKRRASPTAGE